MANALKEVIGRHLKELEEIDEEELLSLRYKKFRRMGTFIDEGRG
jgi:acetyl-CoA carboxylase alpha subunit